VRTVTAWKPLGRTESGRTSASAQCTGPHQRTDSRTGTSRFVSLSASRASRYGASVPYIDHQGTQYKLHALVSNMDWQGNGSSLPYDRCGKSEEAHAILKDDLAEDAPFRRLRRECGWWWINVIAFNSMQP